MNSEIEHLGEELRAGALAFLLRIQTTRKVDREAFERIDRTTRRLAELWKKQSEIPKKLLWEIRAVIKVLLAEAPYIDAGNNPLAEMASKLETTFDLILIGEDHRDRAPGVPRIL